VFTIADEEEPAAQFILAVVTDLERYNFESGKPVPT